MYTSKLLVFAFLATLSSVCTGSSPFDETTLSAHDGSINASFVGCGATMTKLVVKNRDGGDTDVIPGYDDNSKLLTDPGHPLLLIPLHNAMVGRYANRIKNGTFSIPITRDPQPNGPNVYHTSLNDHNGGIADLNSVKDTLHGGILGWDRRNWTLVEKSPTSVTYRHVDTADEGFPGNVTVTTTHTVSNGGILRTSVHATATEKTPIMVTQHIYWMLDGFQYNSSDILAHQLQIPASRIIEVDGNGIPTGNLPSVAGTPYDFRITHAIGDAFHADQTALLTLVSADFQGYDNGWIHDDAAHGQTTLSSKASGIKLEISTNQPATQVYTAWLNMPRKEVHGGPALQYGPHSTVAIEQEGWLDAINNPEWGVDQIYDPTREFVWWTEYRFSISR
ncbi:galactose mutarotase-like protein [Mycena galericulata]|nr:galactose mutarotase-like protein [Mycena galericulata]